MADLENASNSEYIHFDSKRKDSLDIGSFVIALNESWRKPRLDKHFIGPYKVVEELSGDCYRLTKLEEQV